jgi:hypothetical protein
MNINQWTFQSAENIVLLLGCSSGIVRKHLVKKGKGMALGKSAETPTAKLDYDGKAHGILQKKCTEISGWDPLSIPKICIVMHM